jgi:hypothetical protein
MNKIALLFFFCSLYSLSQAQISAVTSTGEEVTLYSNGTWKYTNKTDDANVEIPTNKTPFEKPTSSTFTVKSTVLPEVTVALNPKKWDFKKAEAGAAAEYNFDLKNKDAYGMIITERVEIPLETLKNLALKNARAASPDIEVVKCEYRTVNKKKVLYMQMEGSVEGINFTYYGYYYTYEGGAVQLLTYTSRNLALENKSDMEDLLNGLVASK